MVRTFLNILPFHGHYSVDQPAEFLINDTFSVPYTGAVVAGVVNSGTIHNGDTLWMVIANPCRMLLTVRAQTTLTTSFP